MPRIDPVQLLNCLSVLLSPNGGIKSTDEVQRIASLMTKFSKKLVSKCIYVLILKRTETELLGLFMGSGGWRLAHTWLTEGIVAKNCPLVTELLELLLLCPVDIERLKTNNCPKLVKELSKDGNHFAISALASKLVEQWLKTVKGEHVAPVSVADLPQIITDAQVELSSDIKIEAGSDHDATDGILEVKTEVVKAENTEKISIKMNNDEDVLKIKDIVDKESDVLPVLKISVKDGKQILSQIDDGDSKLEQSDRDKSKDRPKSKSKDKSHDKSNSRSSSSSKHSSKSHSSSSDKEKSCHKSSSSSRHSSKEKSSRDRDKHSSHSSKSKSDSSSKKSDKSSSSSTKSRDEKSQKTNDKEKSKEKENKKDDPKSNDKPQPPSIHKLGKIPKLSDVKKEKPSISIEVRKPDEPKPKTVKTFHSKFRKHGLEEEIKPPPSRAALLNKKVLPVMPPTIPVPKRPSPVHNETPPEKKIKTIEPIEKPGSIKLIKPKPMLLLESDMFMDALNASATNKKEPKKRKRRTSGSKDGNAPSDNSPPHTPTPTSPNENKSVPPRFYQDTLDTDENKSSFKQSDTKDISEKIVSEKEIDIKMDTSEPHTQTINGLKGVLCYHKRKGPKKSIKWKPDTELEEIQYFELDETERVNVTKTFTDMKHLERIHEREAFQKGRNLDDVMEEKTIWRPLIPVDTEGQIQVDYGKQSKEKEIQAIRQKGTLQPLYFHKSMIPDSALEPEPETHTYTEPTIIPLEDVTGNQDNISDFRNMPWPEPKGNAPPASSNMNMQNMFPTNMSQFPGGFQPPQFTGMPGFQAPNVPTEWQNAIPPMMPNGMNGMPPGALVAPGVMPPGMMVPPENMMMNPEMFGAPNAMFAVPPDGFNMQPNMFPMDFNMAGPGGPVGPGPGPGPDGFAGPGIFRGGMRGRGAWRGKGSGNWEGPTRGRGGYSRGGRKAVCIYFQRKGSCRQGDNCSFLHPGVNGPY